MKQKSTVLLKVSLNFMLVIGQKKKETLKLFVQKFCADGFKKYANF